MIVILFLLITIAIGSAYFGNRKIGIMAFFATLIGCILMLFHLATSTLNIYL